MNARPRAIKQKERHNTVPKERVLNKEKRILDPRINVLSNKPHSFNPKERALSPSR